jgi:hypothetical protein
MDDDFTWSDRNTRPLEEVHAAEELEARYIISEKKEDKSCGILVVDFDNKKLVLVSLKNLYKIKKIVTWVRAR